MKLIVVADIFGKTDSLEELAGELGEKYQAVKIVDPYATRNFDFTNEKEAYCYFQEKIGLEDYSCSLAEVLEDERHTVCHIIGFSVGASALWLSSDKALFHPKTKAVGFYSSQIRNFLHSKPLVDFDLFFPRYEEHFDVGEVVAELEINSGVNCYHTDYLHGFMNKKSTNYSEEGYRKYLKHMLLESY